MIKVDYNELLPRTQPDRYNHALLEQLVKLNENVEKLGEFVKSLKPVEAVETVETVQVIEPVEDKPKKKKKE